MAEDDNVCCSRCGILVAKRAYMRCKMAKLCGQCWLKFPQPYLVEGSDLSGFIYARDWSGHEEKKFIEALANVECVNWHYVANMVGTKTANECKSHFIEYKNQPLITIAEVQHAAITVSQGVAAASSDVTVEVQRAATTLSQGVVTASSDVTNVTTEVQRPSPKVNQGGKIRKLKRGPTDGSSSTPRSPKEKKRRPWSGEGNK